MKHFFKFLVAFFVLADIFFIALFGFLFFMIIHTNEYEQLYVIIPLFIVAVLFFGFIEVLLLKYYGNVVISVSFENENCVIKTNIKEYVLPSEKFYKVEDCRQGRIFLFYDDGDFKRKFTFQKKYFPFHNYNLNIDEMRVHMTNAVFR